jgi:hypothetical protein
MEHVVTKHSDGIRWKGRKVVPRDFKEVREYIDWCLRPSNAAEHLVPILVSDFRLLLALLDEVDAVIPWPTKEEIDGTLKSLPERPRKPIQPRMPEILAEFKDLAKMRADCGGKIERQRALQVNGLSGKFASKQIAKYQKLISESESWEKLHQEWLRNHQSWMEEDALYERMLPEFNKKTRRHGELLEAYKESVPLKKIVVRLSKEIKRAIEVGGTIERVNWKLLPKGEGLGDAFRNHLEGVRRQTRGKQYDPGSLDKNWTLRPERIFVGQDEFDGYYVFVFEKYPVAVLECPWVGNALYLISKDRWVALSRLSKSSLLDSDCRDVERLIHGPSGDWFDRLCSKVKGRGVLGGGPIEAAPGNG